MKKRNRWRAALDKVAEAQRVRGAGAGAGKNTTAYFFVEAGAAVLEEVLVVAPPVAL